jgi:hypothetical protein
MYMYNGDKEGKFGLRKGIISILRATWVDTAGGWSLIAKERQQIAIKIYKQLWIHPKLQRCLVFVERKVINIIPVAGLDVLSA